MSATPKPKPADFCDISVQPVQAPDGRVQVLVQAEHLHGVFRRVLEPELAFQFSEALAEAARVARTGIITAGSLPPDLDGRPK